MAAPAEEPRERAELVEKAIEEASGTEVPKSVPAAMERPASEPPKEEFALKEERAPPTMDARQDEAPVLAEKTVDTAVPDVVGTVDDMAAPAEEPRERAELVEKAIEEASGTEVPKSVPAAMERPASEPPKEEFALKEEKAPPTMDAQQDEAVLAPSPPVTDSCGEAPVYEEPLQEKAASVAAPADQAMKEASESTGDAPKEEIASAVETEEKGPLLVDAPQDEAVPAQVLEAKAQPAEKSSKDESAVHGAPVESTPNETCSKAEVVEKKETSLGDAQSSEALPKAKTSKDRVSFEQDPAPASPKRVASARQIPEQVDILREWEVVLAKTEDGQRFGFSHSSGRHKFEKSRGSLGSRGDLGNIEEGPDVLVVTKLSGSGVLDAWNAQHPEAAVQPHDRIAEVNGMKTIDSMVQELRKPTVHMRVVRYPDAFHVELLKRPEMKKYGFKFEKPSNAKLAELRITDMSETGLLEEVNRRHISEGLHHLVVTPGMRIIAANAAEGDAASIAQELRNNDRGVRLRIRRSDIIDGAKDKVKQKMSVLRAFSTAKSSGSRMASEPGG